MIRWLIFALIVVSTTAYAEPQTLAVTAFDNHSGDPQYDPLGRGLQEMLVTDLSHVPGLQIVERARLQQVLKELNLAKSAFIDPKTAAKMGRGVGARWVLTGSIGAIAPQMRLDARIIDVQSSTIVAATQVTGPTDEFFLLEKELVGGLLRELQMDVSPSSQARIGRVQTESFEAFQAWSQGMRALDAGSVDEAADKLAEALSHDARFGAAQTALADLKGRLAQLEAARSDLYGRETKRIMEELERIDRTGDWAALQRITASLITQSTNVPNAQRRTIDRAILDLQVPAGLPVSPNTPLPLGVTEWAMFDMVAASFDDGRRADVLTWGERFAKRYPASVYNNYIRARINDTMQRIADEKAGRERTGQIVEEAWYIAHSTLCLTGPERSPRAKACEDYVTRGHRAGLADKNDLTRWINVADDARDDTQLSRASVWARAHDFDELADTADRRREYLARAIDKYKALDMSTEQKAATDSDDLQLLASRAWDAGHEQQAWQLYEQSQRDYPDDPYSWSRAWKHAEDVLDLERAERYVDGAKAAGHPSGDGKNVIDRIRRDRAELAEVPAVFLEQLAHRYNSAKLYVQAHDTWLQLAKRWPLHSPCDRPCALVHAANATVKSMTPGQHERMRALYRQVLDEHPDSSQAVVARTLLTTLPK